MKIESNLIRERAPTALPDERVRFGNTWTSKGLTTALSGVNDETQASSLF